MRSVEEIILENMERGMGPEEEKSDAVEGKKTIKRKGTIRLYHDDHTTNIG